MIAARITALVLCVYTSGPWIILFIGNLVTVERFFCKML